MGKRIDDETRSKIVQKYLATDDATYADIGRVFGINQNTISKIIRQELQSGTGIKPDRRAKTIKLSNGIEFEREELEAQHPRTSDWMQHITPLHKHKQALELAIEHKQAELDAAKQELRDFTATLRQLMEGDV